MSNAIRCYRDDVSACGIAFSSNPHWFLAPPPSQFLPKCKPSVFRLGDQHGNSPRRLPCLSQQTGFRRGPGTRCRTEASGLRDLLSKHVFGILLAPVLPYMIPGETTETGSGKGASFPSFGTCSSSSKTAKKKHSKNPTGS